MKLNASKTKTMIVCRSRTVHLQLTSLTLDGTVLKESADLVILGVTFDEQDGCCYRTVRLVLLNRKAAVTEQEGWCY